MRRRRLLAVLLAAVFLVSGVWAAVVLLDNYRSAHLYTETAAQFVQAVIPAAPAAPQTTDAPEEKPVRPFPEMAIDFDALRAANEDIVAWVWVPGTTISYPVLQGENNQQYLNRTYTGTVANAGSIFMDYKNAPDFTDPNSIIYGHNMRSGNMFGALQAFREQSYADEHPYFCVITPEGQLNYDIFAVTVVDMHSDVYTIAFGQDKTFADFMDLVASQNLIEADVEVAEGDRICTLSTCTSVVWSDRLVVLGRLWTDP